MQSRRLLWVLIAVHLSIACYGFALNDEADQIAALHNLAQGSLRVKEVPESAYQTFDNISWDRRWDDRPVASTPLNLLALPTFAAVKLMALVAPLGLWFSAATAVAIWKAVGLPMVSRAGHATPVLGVCALALLLGAGLRDLGPDVDYYGAAIALNLTSLVLGIVGSLLAWQLLGQHVQGTWRVALLTALIAGPWLYWARLAKYHMLSAVLILAISWVLDRERTAKRQLLLGVLVGVTYWAHFAVGLVAGLALLTVEIIRLARKPPKVPRNMHGGALLAGLVLGVLPSMLENQYLFGNPFLNFYFASDSTGGPGEAQPWWMAVWGVFLAIPRIASHLLHWNGPVDFALNLFSILTLGDRLEGNAIGFFLISPIFLISFVGLWKLVRERAAVPEWGLWGAAFLAWQILLGTNAGVRQGAGYDPRLWFHVWPILAMFAGFGISRSGLQRMRFSKLSIVLGLGTVALMLLVARVVTLAGYRFRHGPAQAAEFMMAGAWIFAALGIVFAAALIVVRPTFSRRAATVAVAFLLAVPMTWSSLYVLGLHPRLPDTWNADGGGMALPASNALSDFVYHSLSPITRKPLVWDDNGVLVFHPDFGSCLVEPNPCPDVPMPEQLRKNLEAMQNGTAE